MNKKIVSIAMLWILIAAFGAIVSVYAQYTPVDVRDPYHYKDESIGDPETVDPAWAYDTASAELIFNVYDPLVFFDRTEVGEFIPVLSTTTTEWINQPPHPAAPVGTNSTWYFTIREGVKFQDGSTLTTEDVEFSFERAMVQDRSGGPVWMFNEPLVGEGWPDKSGWAEAAGNPIDTAVESNSTHVWFNLAMPYPPFMQILCQSWASILSKAWCSGIAGEWDGDWTDWKSHADPDNSPLDVAGDLMMGTGPYMLDYWDHGIEYSITAFNMDDTGWDYEYWNGWPAENAANYLKRCTFKVNYEWGVRKANFETGVADTVYVPTAYLPQMILNWPTDWSDDAKTRLDAEGDPEYFAEGLRCLSGITTLQVAAYHFNVDIPAASPYYGTGSFPDGIPLDFWGDKRIRQAFAYCFDYDAFLEDMYWGEAEQPPSCVIRGLLYFNPANPKYTYDLTKAKELFVAASNDPASPAYQVWDQGFTCSMTYNTGNVPRETTVTMMAEGVGNLFALGPDLTPDTGDEAGGDATITIASVPWPTYLGELVSGILPIFIYGWLADYPDPHNFVVPYMHTYGDFVHFQHYSNSTIDALIEQGIQTPDGPAREAIYHTLQLMYFQDCPSVCTASGYGRHWERDWYQGWYHNPIYPGFYAYDKWKGLNGDINIGSASDGKVDMLDLGAISGHWYPGPPEGPEGYGVIADIFPENWKVLAEDPYEATPKVWDSETQSWIPDPSIRAVDIFDAGVVSAHWLEQINPI